MKSRNLEKVATSTLNHKMSRHQLQGIMVATSVSGRDISYKERRSRRPSVVATSVSGCDISQWSRHQLQGKKVATSTAKNGGRDIIYLSRHQIQKMLKTSRDQIKASATDEENSEFATYD